MQDSFQAAGLPYSVYIVELPESSYKFTTGVDPFDAYDFGDYNYKTGFYRALCVEYPANYYACNRYISTYELQKTAKRYAAGRGSLDLETVKNMVRYMCEC